MSSSNEVNDNKFGYTLTKTQECNPKENGIFDQIIEKSSNCGYPKQY